MDVEIAWSAEKNAELKQRYGVGFERVVSALGEGGLLDDRSHPNSSGKYGHQRQLVILIDAYVWLVPYVQREDGIFLKTMFPHRKATRDYLERRP